MRGTVRDEKRYAYVKALLKLNPSASYARIGREAGLTGQMVGVIARENGMPRRSGGGFNSRDDAELRQPAMQDES